MQNKAINTWNTSKYTLVNLAFGRPPSAGGPYHGQPISIVNCHLLLSEIFLFQVQSTALCCPFMTFLVFLLFFFLVVCLGWSLSPSSFCYSSWCGQSISSFWLSLLPIMSLWTSFHPRPTHFSVLLSTTLLISASCRPFISNALILHSSAFHTHK